MFSRKLTRPLAVAAAAIALAGGAYGIVDATAGNGSASSTATTPLRRHQGDRLSAEEDPTLAPDRPQGEQPGRSTASPSRVSRSRRQPVRR